MDPVWHWIMPAQYTLKSKEDVRVRQLRDRDRRESENENAERHVKRKVRRGKGCRHRHGWKRQEQDKINIGSNVNFPEPFAAVLAEGVSVMPTASVGMLNKNPEFGI